MHRLLGFAAALAIHVQLTFAAAEALKEEFKTSVQAQVRQGSSFGGLTYDICRAESDCKGERVCRVFMDTMFPPQCAEDDYLCLCFPKVPDFCTTSSDCKQGEQCANFYGGPSSECVSKNAPGAKPVDVPPSPSRSTSTSSTGSTGLSGVSPSPSTRAVDRSSTPGNSASPSSAVQALEIPSSSASLQGTTYVSSSPSISFTLSPDPSTTPSSVAVQNTPSPSFSQSAFLSPASGKPSSKATSSPYPSGSASLSSSPIFTASPSSKTSETPEASPSSSRAASGVNTQSTNNASSIKKPGETPTKSPKTESPAKSEDSSQSSTTSPVTSSIRTPSPSAIIQMIPVTAPKTNTTARGTPIMTASTSSNTTVFPERSIIPLPSHSPTASPRSLINVETIVTPSPDPDDVRSGVCVDANALRHLKPHDLVFTSHYWTKVLCDSNNSCATAGHMVAFQGKVMMMKTYCKNAGCSHREMLVNSPRFKRGRRVQSNTEGLEYMALAAKYASRMEEAALVVVARLDGILA